MHIITYYPDFYQLIVGYHRNLNPYFQPALVTLLSIIASGLNQLYNSFHREYCLAVKNYSTLKYAKEGLVVFSVSYHAKQKQPGCKKSARPIRSHNGYKRPKSLISSKAKKLNILLRILLLE